MDEMDEREKKNMSAMLKGECLTANRLTQTQKRIEEKMYMPCIVHAYTKNRILVLLHNFFRPVF